MKLDYQEDFREDSSPLNHADFLEALVVATVRMQTAVAHHHPEDHAEKTGWNHDRPTTRTPPQNRTWLNL